MKDNVCDICGRHIENRFSVSGLCERCKEEALRDTPPIHSDPAGEDYWKAKFEKWCSDYHKLNGMIEIPHDYNEIQKQRDNFLLGIRITIATTPDKYTVKYLTDVIAVYNLKP